MARLDTPNLRTFVHRHRIVVVYWEMTNLDYTVRMHLILDRYGVPAEDVHVYPIVLALPADAAIHGESASKMNFTDKEVIEAFAEFLR